MPARRRIHWGFGVLAAVAVALIAWAIFHKPPEKPTKSNAVPVTAARVAAEDVPVSITALGAAQAWTSDTILAQVSGKLIRVNFAEGSDVKAGQLLAEVDPAPYQAALTQAEGTLRRDQALLAEARVDLARYATLNAENSIARQQYEDQQGVVKQDEGVVQIDQGAVAAAKVNLRWCHIVSPISGRAGVRLVDPGNLVSASGSVASVPSTAAATNSTSPTATTSSGGASGSGIVVINQVQPIAVTFTVPEGDFDHLSQLTDGFRKPLAAEAYSQETGASLGVGELTTADNRVDPTTGAVELKARFANAANGMWPGQFVNLKLQLQTLKGALAIPATAVNRGPNGTFAFVVGAGNKVFAQPVTVSLTQGQTAVIASGLRAGQVVVTDGQMTLKNGSVVRIVRAGQAAKAPSS